MAVLLHPIDHVTCPPTIAADYEHRVIVLDVPRPFSDEVDEWQLTADQAMRYGARLMSAGTAMHEFAATRKDAPA